MRGNPTSQPDECGWCNAHEQSFSLNSRGQRTSVIEKGYTGSSATAFSKTRITWHYDDADRLTAETRDIDTTPGDSSDNFGVADSLGGSGGDYSDIFAYDLANNRTSKKRGWDANLDGALTGSETVTETITFSHNSNDQLTGEDSSINSNDKTYTYDNNGSQISVTQNSVTTYYLWDLRNRMIGISLDNDGNATDTGETQYYYDSDGVRVSQITYGTTNAAIAYLNDSLNQTGYSKTLEKRTGSSVAGATTLDTTYFLGQRVEGQKDTTGTVYFARDGHNSVRGMTDSASALVTNQVYAYTAFGDPVGFTPSSARTMHQFGGDGVFDAKSGWTYHLARWRSGFRFTSMDSYMGENDDPASLHKYTYVQNNPVMYTDPSGYFIETLATTALSVAQRGQQLAGMTMATAATAGLVSAATYMSASIAIAIESDLGEDSFRMQFYKEVQARSLSVMESSWSLFQSGFILGLASTVIASGIVYGLSLGGSRALTQVTSWAGRGLTPDLNTGRWVTIGSRNLWNWTMTLKPLGSPFANAITDYIAANRLITPLTGILAHRIIN
jgi:RHS repeat-associated protein